MKRFAAAVLLAAAPCVLAQPKPAAPEVDAKQYPAMSDMLTHLRNGSEASRYCARTGGLYLEADAMLRRNMAERDVVDALVRRGKDTLAASEAGRLREIATAVTQLASGFRSLASESSAVAYTQTCLASTRAAPATRSQSDLNERYAAALGCDRMHKPGSLEGKECVARAFEYR